jgi:hypothetical protein
MSANRSNDRAEPPTLTPEAPTVTPEARRALDEARARRNGQSTPPGPRELGGRDGLEPTRYGDWENKGIASDF